MRPYPLSNILAIALVALPAASCTRTYDGTVVPAYQPKIVQTRVMPVVVLRRTPIDPPNLRYRYPDPPPQPVQIARNERRPAVARSRARRPQAAPAPAPMVNQSTVRCRNETSGSGRVRVVCA